MIVKKLVLICPECSQHINCSIDDVAFEMMDSQLIANLECPNCGALIEEEPLEKEQ